MTFSDATDRAASEEDTVLNQPAYQPQSQATGSLYSATSAGPAASMGTGPGGPSDPVSPGLTPPPAGAGEPSAAGSIGFGRGGPGSLPDQPGNAPDAGVSVRAWLLDMRAGGLPILQDAAAAAGLTLRSTDDPERVFGSAAEHPTLAVLSVPLVDDSVLGLIATIAERTGGVVPVVVLTGQADVDRAIDCCQRGAATVLAPPLDRGRMQDQLRRAAALATERFAETRQRRELLARYQRLTRKERDVLRLVQDGRSNRQIASELDISVRAVEDRRSRAMRRMEASSLVGLIRMLYRIGDDIVQAAED